MRTECILSQEGFDFALAVHREAGHFRTVETLKLRIHETMFWPGIEQDCRAVVLECPECKLHGLAYHNTLLQPLCCSCPFSMLCGDYLSMPKGKGAYFKVGFFVDVFSGFVWGYKLAKEPTTKCTVDCLTEISDKLITPNTFMADSGSHFNRSHVMQEFCNERGIKHLTTPVYAPWANGLVEGLNCLLLGRLQRLCSPDEDLPHSWSTHFEEAIHQLNNCSCINTRRTPRELLFGLTLMPEHTESATPTSPFT